MNARTLLTIFVCVMLFNNMGEALKIKSHATALAHAADALTSSDASTTSTDASTTSTDAAGDDVCFSEQYAYYLSLGIDPSLGAWLAWEDCYA